MPEGADFLRKAIELATENVRSGRGGPFGAVIVKDGVVVGSGANQVTGSNDPTAHAEVVAIRDACRRLATFELTGCDLYTSCEPCPMCLAAAYWARCRSIVFGNTAQDAAEAGFDDARLYAELQAPRGERSVPLTRLLPAEARVSFDLWQQSPYKVVY